MLKPKKNITRKEIQRDPFLESVDQAQAHLEENRSLYMKAAIGLIIVLLGYNIMKENSAQRKLDASAALGQALVALDRGDVSNAQFQLETVLNEFKGTPSSSVAGYYLGKMRYESGDVTQAEQYLTVFFNDKPVDIMVSSAALMLSDIDAQGNDMNGAVSYLDQGIKKSRDAHTTRMLELSKARLFLKQGNLEGARGIVDGLLAKKDLSSDQKQAAEEIIGNIVG